MCIRAKFSTVVSVSINHGIVDMKVSYLCVFACVSMSVCICDFLCMHVRDDLICMHMAHIIVHVHAYAYPRVVYANSQVHIIFMYAL